MLVMKFGGTSLGGADQIDTMVGLVRGRLSRRPVLVCSAHSKVTDLLLAGAQGGRGRASPTSSRSPTASTRCSRP